MRGKGGAPRLAFCHVGITPAYAGKRCYHEPAQGRARDHPRVCGEKQQGQVNSYRVRGSPPRMRGKVGLCLNPGIKERITPAYAGKRHWKASVPIGSRDHPRVCGEKSKSLKPKRSGCGSPPRMRGKETHSCDQNDDQRITPAYAGKRLKRSRSTVPPVAIVPLFPSVCNKPVVSGGSPAGRDAPLFLPAENAVPASPAYNLRSL